MNQTGFRFPDNPTDPTGRHCSHPARKYAWICRERAPGTAINIGEIEELRGKGHFCTIDHFFNRGEKGFQKGFSTAGSVGWKFRRFVENIIG